MTITSNIFVGIAAWTPSTSYVVGNRRSNGGNAYQCIKDGTSASAGGPSGTGTSITDGTAAWKFLASVDYVTMASWASGVPGTLSQPVVANIWNCGPITTTLGTPFFTLTGHTTTATNNITIKAAAGDGIRDLLGLGSVSSPFTTEFSSEFGPFGQWPLTPSINEAVSFVLPSSGAGNINYIVINDANVVIDGLQFIDPNPASNSSILRVNGASAKVRGCIFDGYSQVGGASILDLEATTTVADTLVLDRMGASDSAVTVFASATVKLVNNTFICVNSNSANGSMLSNSATGTYVRNCAIFGYGVLLGSSSTAASFDHCGTSVTSLASPITNGGSNKLSLTAANQFVDVTNDFRIKVGSALISGGVTDTADIPSADDIGRRTRLGWSIGAWQYTLLAASASPVPYFTRLTGYFTDASGNRFYLDNALNAFEVLASDGSTVAIGIYGDIGFNAAALEYYNGNVYVQDVRDKTWHTFNGSSFSAAVAAPPMMSMAMATQAIASASLAAPVNSSQAVSSFLTLRAAGAAKLVNNVSGSGRIMFMQSAVSAVGRNQMSETARVIALSANGAAALTQLGSATVSLMTLSAIGQIANSAIGQATIMALQASVGVAQPGGIANIMSLSSTATAMPLLLLSGAINLDFLSFGQMTSATSASGTMSLLGMRCSASLSQQKLASGTVTLFAVTGRGTIGASMSARISVLPLSCSSSVAEFNDASCIVTFDVLAVHKPPPLLLNSDAVSPLTLAADGSGLLLAADVIQRNITSQTFCSGRSPLPALSCSASALFQIFASSSDALAFSASALMRQNSLVSGIGTIPALRCAASTTLRDVASGIASLQRLTASVSMSQVGTISGSATIPAITAASTAQGFDIASGISTLSFSASGLALTSGTAIGRATIGSLLATGTGSFALGLTGRSTVALTALGQATQIASASATAMIQTSVSGVANQHIFASGLAVLPALTASGAMASTNRASGTGIIPSLSATGGAVNANNPAQGITTILALGAVGDSMLHGAYMSGSATIRFVGSGLVTQEVAASVLVELEQIVAAHAKLWTTPIGYESGGLIVYWAD